MAGMREMWREARPVGAIADLMEVHRQAGKNSWWLMCLAALTTFAVFSIMLTQNWKGARARPQITYINSWPEDRSEAETKAFVVENQRRKELREAELDKLIAAERDAYKQLGAASGMDVDKIEKRANAERAAEEAAAKAKTDAILKQHLVEDESSTVASKR